MTLPIRQFKAGNYIYGLICTEKKYIIVDTDFCHYIYNNEDNVELDFFSEVVSVSLEYLNFASFQIKDLTLWGHYWGIKNRVRSNYNLLLETMQHYNIDVSEMPKWPRD